MGLLLFKKCFWDSIRDGSKRTTIRRWDRPRVKAGGRAYAMGLGWLSVSSVEVVELCALGEADARADGFASREEMLIALAGLYPDAPADGRRWYRVGFVLEKTVEKRPRARRPRATRALKRKPAGTGKRKQKRKPRGTTPGRSS